MRQSAGAGGWPLGLLMTGMLACQGSEGTDVPPTAADVETSDTIPLDTSPRADATPADVPVLEDVWQVPLFPGSATRVVLAEAIPVTQTAISEQPAVVVAAVQGDWIITQNPEGTQLFDTTWSALDGEIGTLLETAEWGEDTLLACEGGLFVLHARFLFESPIQDLIPGEAVHTVRTMEQAVGSAVWLGTESALYTWEDSTLFEVLPAGLPTGDAHVLAGAYEESSAIWVAADGWLYAMWEDADGLVSVQVHDALPVSSMTMDSEQRLWLLSAGDLVIRHPSGVWEWLSFPEPIDSLYGASHSGLTWVVLPQSVIVHHNGLFHPVKALSPPVDAAIAGDGALLAATPDGLFRVSTTPDDPPGVVTWGQQIEPLFEEKCAKCHNPNGIAQDLSERETWIEKIDLILLQVQTEMPADDPPLDAIRVALIQHWVDGGFVE